METAFLVTAMRVPAARDFEHLCPLQRQLTRHHEAVVCVPPIHARVRAPLAPPNRERLCTKQATCAALIQLRTDVAVRVHAYHHPRVEPYRLPVRRFLSVRRTSRNLQVSLRLHRHRHCVATDRDHPIARGGVLFGEAGIGMDAGGHAVLGAFFGD